MRPAEHPAQPRAERQLSMIKSGIGLMAGKGLAMGLGFLYWLLGARLYPPEVVGIAGAAIAGVMLVSQLGVFGFESAIVARYPEYEEARDRLFNTAFTLVGLATLAVAGIAAAIALGIDGELADVVRDPALLPMFLGMSVVAGVVIVLDQASMALRRGDHVVTRNGLNGVLSIVPLLAMWMIGSSGRGGSAVLFGSWVFGASAGLVLGGSQLLRLRPRYSYRPRMEATVATSLVKTGLSNHLLTLTERVPVLVLPLLVTERISAQANAYWYAVWMVAWATLVIARSLSFALFAEASRRKPDFSSDVVKALRSSLLFGSAAAAATIIAAPLVLGLLGSDYADAGTAALRVLVLSFAPYSVVMTYFALCRGTGRLREATVFGALLAATVIMAATFSTSAGLTRVALSWLVVVAAYSVVAGVRLRSLVGQSRTHPDPQTPSSL